MAFFYATLVIVLLQSFLFGYGFNDSVGMMSESDLRRELFANYDKLVRPVKKYSKGITVNFGLSPVVVRELDEKTQLLTLDSFIFMGWTDDYLQWDPNDYDGINVLRIPPTEVWKPDISLYTAPTDEPLMPTSNTQVLIYSNGSVWWFPPYTVRSRCTIPFSKVPKHVVECNIRFGSWVYGAEHEDFKLISDKVDLTYFTDSNNHWKLVKIISSRRDKYYPCCPENYPVMDYNITLMRRFQNKNADYVNLFV